MTLTSPFLSQDLPPFRSQRQIYQYLDIAAYLRRLMEDRLSPMVPCMLVPAMRDLAKFFDCSYAELHEAMKFLQHQGYDYSMTGLGGPITLWDKPRLRSRHAAQHL